MKLSAGILLVTLSAAASWAQIPSVVQHVQDKLNDAQQQKKAASDAALKPNVAKAPAAKPSAAVAAKPASAPVAKAAMPAPKASSSPASAKPATAKAATSPAASQPIAAKAVTTAKPAGAVAATATTPAAKKQDPFAKAAPPKAGVKAAAPVVADAKKGENKASDTAAAAKPADSGDEGADQKKESGYITAGNRRDPFVSPIVQHLAGAGCSTGKRCLAIDQIALRGIVKSDGGMIAVVVNSLDKAYFLRENDPVFNGYVLKISGDSVVFKETVQDKLGHLSTREVVKKITTPAV